MFSFFSFTGDFSVSPLVFVGHLSVIDRRVYQLKYYPLSFRINSLVIHEHVFFASLPLKKNPHMYSFDVATFMEDYSKRCIENNSVSYLFSLALSNQADH